MPRTSRAKRLMARLLAGARQRGVVSRQQLELQRRSNAPYLLPLGVGGSPEPDLPPQNPDPDPDPPPPPASADFVFTVDTSLSQNDKFMEIYTGHKVGGSLTVDWGDGTVTTHSDLTDEYSGDWVEHTYLTDDVFTVTVSGSLTYLGIGFFGCEMVTACLSFGEFPHWRQEGAPPLFSGCTALVAVPDQLPAHITSLNSAFMNASVFNQDISGWDTSLVTDMGSMFSGATAFNQDLSGWCVPLIAEAPVDFDTGATAWVLPSSRPVWGTCPA